MMSSWFISVLFAAGVATWSYAKLVRSNGNPTPGQDLGAAAVAGVIAFVFFFTLLKFVFKFD